MKRTRFHHPTSPTRPRRRDLVVPALLATLLTVPAAHGGLVQTFQQTGNLGLEVTGVAGTNSLIVSGTLSVSSMPVTAMPVRATVYVSQINSIAPLDLVFNGVPAGVVGPIASDAAFNTLYTFVWDVTPWIAPAQNSWTFTVGQNQSGSGIAGVGLAIVWQDPAEPSRTITIIDGMQQVGESGAETETVTFTGLPAGNTTVWTFTVYDDTGQTGETVVYNGATIGGPIDGNLGLNASVLQMSTTSVSGNNTCAISTINDHMGWMIAATAVDLPPVSVDPRSWGAMKADWR